MSKSIIPIINGPNLNLLGIREPSIYGNQSFEDYIWHLREKFDNIIIPYHQSNHEGDIIDLLHFYGFNTKGILLNAGGYTHTSISIADAINAIDSRVVEVHISDIYKREEFRHHSYLKANCVKSIVGKGILGYDEALEYLLN